MTHFLPPASVIDSTPGLSEALAVVTKAEADRAAVKRPERALNEVSRFKPGASTEREPLPGVPFAEWDAVRVDHDLYNAALATADRTLDDARKRADGLIFGHGLTVDALEARNAALAARVEELHRVIDSEPLTSAQRAALVEEAKVLEVFGVLSGESLRGVLTRNGLCTMVRPVADADGAPIPGLFRNVRVSLEDGVEEVSRFATSEYQGRRA